MLCFLVWFDHGFHNLTALEGKLRVIAGLGVPVGFRSGDFCCMVEFMGSAFIRWAIATN